MFKEDEHGIKLSQEEITEAVQFWLRNRPTVPLKDVVVRGVNFQCSGCHTAIAVVVKSAVYRRNAEGHQCSEKCPASARPPDA